MQGRQDAIRVTRLLLVIAIAGVLVATAVAPTLAQSPKRGGVFRLPAPDAVSLDPHDAGLTTQMYASPVYTHLVRFPAGHEATGAGDHRILTLRKGVRFHKKPPVNARERMA